MRTVEILDRHKIHMLTPEEQQHERVKELEDWFKNVFTVRYAKIKMYSYFRIQNQDNEYSLFTEALEKEREYRELTGGEALPEIIALDLF